MSIFVDGVDPFEGLRQLPTDAEQLRTHMTTIHETMQRQHHISAEASDFALDQTRSSEFFDYYKTEVQRTIEHLNRVTGSAYRVRVDPTRMAKGMELRRGTPSPTPSSPPPHSNAGGDGAADPEWVASMNASAQRLMQQQAIDHQRAMMAAESNKENTPASQKSLIFRQQQQQHQQSNAGGNSITFSPYDDSTAGIDSNVKQVKDQDHIFATPPMFRGFNGNSPYQK